MATTFTWSITGLKTIDAAPYRNVIHTAAFRILARDDEGRDDELALSVILPPPDRDFVPFANVTEPEVLAWVRQALDAKPATRAAVLERELAARLALRQPAMAPEEQPVPWGGA